MLSRDLSLLAGLNLLRNTNYNEYCGTDTYGTVIYHHLFYILPSGPSHIYLASNTFLGIP